MISSLGKFFCQNQEKKGFYWAKIWLAIERQKFSCFTVKFSTRDPMVKSLEWRYCVLVLVFQNRTFSETIWSTGQNWMKNWKMNSKLSQTDTSEISFRISIKCELIFASWSETRLKSLIPMFCFRIFITKLIFRLFRRWSLGLKMATHDHSNLPSLLDMEKLKIESDVDTTHSQVRGQKLQLNIKWN